MNPASNAVRVELDDDLPTDEPMAVDTAVESNLSFADLGLAPVLVEALARLDIKSPTPVQAQAIPMLLEGRDLIASAPTGTGKTAAFMLPALHRCATVDSRKGRGPRVLVLTPTRELAQQVGKAAQSFSRLMPRTSTVTITGGESYLMQNKLLAAPHEVLVATPGRLMDQMNSGRIDFSRVEFFVLDEADRMLDMGFSEDVTAIAQALPAERQTVCFTATLSRGVRALAGELLKDPEWMTVERTEEDSAPIDEHVLYVDNFDHRNRLLAACLADEGLGQAIIFTSTKRHADELAQELFRMGTPAEALHGDLSQRDRTRALNKLRRGDCKVLVATDVAARGIDVSTITHVINFDLPKFAEDYVHRIGRTGRAGLSGQALSFVGREDVFALRKIEHFLGRKIQVSALDGLEAEFKPLERKPRDGRGGGSFRKPGFGNKGGWGGNRGFGPRRDGGFDGQRREGGFNAQRNEGGLDGQRRDGNVGAGQRNEGGFEGQRREGHFGGPRREGNFGGPRHEGGFNGQRREGNFGGPRQEGGFNGQRREGGFGGPRHEGGFNGQRREGNFGGPRQEGGFGGQRREGGFGGQRREGGFGAQRNEGGFGAQRNEGGFGGQRREGGFGGQRREGGFGGPRNEGGFNGPRRSFDKRGPRGGHQD